MKNELSKDFEIMRTSEGYMVYDHQTDDYLHDSNGDNCFNSLAQAVDLAKTRLDSVGAS